MASPQQVRGEALRSLASTNIQEYIKQIQGSNEYQSLIPASQQAVHQKIYNDRVVPFYQQRGQTPPPPEDLGIPFSDKPAAPTTPSGSETLLRSGVGLARGLTRSAQGILSAPFKIANAYEEADDYLRNSSDHERAINFNKRVLSSIDSWSSPEDNYFEEHKAKTFGQTLAGEGAELVGELPSFIGVGKVFKGAEGLNLVGRTFARALEGATAASSINQDKDAEAWALFSGAMPILGKALAPVTGAAANVFKSILGATAKIPVGASVKSAATSSTIGQTAKDIINHITNPEVEDVAASAKEDYEKAIKVSPTVQAQAKAIDDIATKAGVKTTSQNVIEKAAKDATKATATSKVASNGIGATTSETRESLLNQIESVATGNKNAVLIDANHPDIDELKSLSRKLGLSYKYDGAAQSILVRPKNVTEIMKKAMLAGEESKILEYPQSKEAIADSISKGETPVIIKASDPTTGAERETIAATSSRAVESAEVAKKHFPEASVEIAPAAEAVDISKERLLNQLSHDLRNVANNEVLGKLNGKTLEVNPERLTRIQTTKDALTKLGASADINDLETKINAIKQKGLDGIVGSASGAASDTALFQQAKKELGITASMSDIAQRAQQLKSGSSSAAVLQIEKREGGLSDAEYRSILSKHGYSSSKDVPETEIENIRKDILNSAIKKQTFFSQGEGIYSTVGKAGEDTHTISPTKTLDLDTKHNPTFMNAVAVDHPDILAKSSDKPRLAYQGLQDKIGEDGTKEWLRKQGYDAIKLGTLGDVPKGQEVLIQALDHNVAKSNILARTEKLAKAATALGIDSSITNKATEAVKTVADAIKPTIKKYNMAGKEIPPSQLEDLSKDIPKSQIIWKEEAKQKFDFQALQRKIQDNKDQIAAISGTINQLEKEIEKHQALSYKEYVARGGINRFTELSDKKFDLKMKKTDLQFGTKENKYTDGLDQMQRDLTQLQSNSSNVTEIRKLPDGRPVLWLNDRAMNLFHRAMVPFGFRSELYGLNTRKETLAQIANERMDYWVRRKPGENYYDPEVNEIADKIKTAVAKLQSMIGPEGAVVMGRKGKGLRATVDTMREEILHSWQTAMSENTGIKTHLLPDDFDRLNRTMPSAMIDYLNQHYSNVPPEMKVIEATAKIMAGKGTKIGVSIEDQADYLNRYFESVQNKWGKQALEKIEHAHAFAAKLRDKFVGRIEGAE